MTNEEKNKCHAIIHSHALACGVGNALPAPGMGLAVDTLAMTSMCMSLAGVFGGNLSEEVAKGMTIVAIKRTALRQPIKIVVKELSKIIPWLGQVVAPTVSIGMIEAAGWEMAESLRCQARSAAAERNTRPDAASGIKLPQRD